MTPPSHRDNWPTTSFWNQKCTKWGVITTIFPVTESSSSMARLEGWCLVVAGDLKGPNSYEVKNATVVFLSAERQKELEPYMAFVRETPWNHFSRKNIAYLYAIANGAEFIWDFDDDNTLFPGEVLSLITELTAEPSNVIQLDTVNNTACGSFNPYNFYGASVPNIWPRGYPLDDINKPECQLATQCIRQVPYTNIGSYQSLANNDPDVDAIYRLTRSLPVNFLGNIKDQNLPVIVPPDTISPMNSQAALFRHSAIWSLFLPTTIHGRVSDIWRSFVAQVLGAHFGMLFSFIGPVVTQYRNVHTYLADMDAEHPLYEQAGALIHYLRQWKYEGDSLEGAIERLYVDLYERGIVEWNDVVLTQLWISTLHLVGYEFPNLGNNANTTSTLFPEEDCSNMKSVQQISRKKVTAEYQGKNYSERGSALLSHSVRYDNVVLVGQFNFNTNINQIYHWVDKWREVFQIVQVRGPFNQSNILELRDHGIDAFVSDDDEGWYSPMKNLAEALRMFEGVEGIKGVILSHDDLLFNISHLVELGFPGNEVLGQALPIRMEKPRMLFNTESMYQHLPDTHFIPVDDMSTLGRWPWWGRCLPNFAKAAKDPRAQQFLHRDGLMPMYAQALGDFAYIPMKYATLFADASDLMVDHKVYIECGMPTLFGILKENMNATVKHVPYCTSNIKEVRPYYDKWIPTCSQGTGAHMSMDPPFGLYHPAKLSVHNFSVWDNYFNMIVCPA